MSRIEPRALRPFSDEPPACAAPAPRAAVPGPRVSAYEPRRARAEQARAVAEAGLGELAVRAALLTLAQGDLLDAQLRGHLRTELAAGVDLRARIRHEGDHTFTVELGARGTLGAGEPVSGARAVTGGEGAARLRFQSAEGAADFLQAAATAGLPLLGSPGRAAVGTLTHLEAVRLGGLLELGVGSHTRGLERELAALGRMGLEVEGGLEVVVDLARGALIIEGRLEGAAVARVNAPWVQLAALGAQVRGEARVQHLVPLPPSTLEALRSGRCAVRDVLTAGETVLTFEGQVDASAVASLAGAGASVRTELQLPLRRVVDVTPDGLIEALTRAEVRTRVYSSREEDMGGLGLDAHVAAVGAGWRTHRLALDVRTTLEGIADVVRRWRPAGQAALSCSSVDVRAAAARLTR